jgi:hypothetical protein
MPETYEVLLEDAVERSSDISSHRDVIASILLDAVLQSFRPGEEKARAWLYGLYAQSLLVLLDIHPEAAMQHLERKWRRIDGSAYRAGMCQPGAGISMTQHGMGRTSM